MGKMQTQPAYSADASFEKVWAILDRTAKRQKELALSQKETDRQLKETKILVDNVCKDYGGFVNNFGEVIEHMVAPNLQEKFYDLGYDFQEASTNHKVHDKKNKIKFEIDVFLQNGDTAMLVEIKSRLLIEDINDHLIRLEQMRKYADLRGDNRRFLGAVAGIVVETKEREYALNNGFFLIEPTGENFFITPPHNKPKEW